MTTQSTPDELRRQLDAADDVRTRWAVRVEQTRVNVSVYLGLLAIGLTITLAFSAAANASKGPAPVLEFGTYAGIVWAVLATCGLFYYKHKFGGANIKAQHAEAEVRRLERDHAAAVAVAAQDVRLPVLPPRRPWWSRSH